MNSFDVDSYEILFWIVVSDTVEVVELNTCSDNGDNGTNHSVNLAISNVAWSCHSNKQDKAFSSRKSLHLVILLFFLNTCWGEVCVHGKNTIQSVRTCLFLCISSTEKRIPQKSFTVYNEDVPSVTGVQCVEQWSVKEAAHTVGKLPSQELRTVIISCISLIKRGALISKGYMLFQMFLTTVSKHQLIATSYLRTSHASPSTIIYIKLSHVQNSSA